MSFERDIRPLFRGRDVRCMAGTIDLNSYDDVKANAQEIYARLTEKDPTKVMPPDHWGATQITRFKEWIDSGCRA